MQALLEQFPSNPPIPYDPPAVRRGAVVAFLAFALLIPALASPVWAAPQGNQEGGEEAISEAGDQPTSDLPPGRRAEVYRVRYGDVHELARIVQAFGIHAESHGSMDIIAMRGLEADLQAALEVLRRLDTPPPPSASVLLKLHVLRASEGGTSSDLPESLEGVGRQLRSSLGYGGLELMDTLVVRSRDLGHVATGGSLGGSHHYGFEVKGVQVLQQEGGGPVVRLQNLEFSLRYPDPGGDGLANTSLATDVEVRDRQQVVVGKTTAAGTGAVILVLEAAVE